MNLELGVHAIGGPTLLIEMGGFRLLTDPTFDPPGEYPIGSRVLTKTAPPAISRSAIGSIDAILLSHDQHADNLDGGGRESLGDAPRVFSTHSAAERLPSVHGLAPWEEVLLSNEDNTASLTVTAVPAEHGPVGTEHLLGPVIGFVLRGVTTPAVYVSGDNASLEVVDSIAERFPNIDVAVLFCGAARTPVLPDAYLTLTSAQAAEAGQRLAAQWVVPAHFNSWTHYTEGAGEITAAFERLRMSSRLVLLAPGEHAKLGIKGREESQPALPGERARVDRAPRAD